MDVSLLYPTLPLQRGQLCASWGVGAMSSQVFLRESRRTLRRPLRPLQPLKIPGVLMARASASGVEAAPAAAAAAAAAAVAAAKVVAANLKQ